MRLVDRYLLSINKYWTSTLNNVPVEKNSVFFSHFYNSLILISWMQELLFLWFWRWSNSCYICSVCLRDQYNLIFCNPMDCSPSGSSVLGTFQARIQESLPFPSPIFVVLKECHQCCLLFVLLLSLIFIRV